MNSNEKEGSKRATTDEVTMKTVQEVQGKNRMEDVQEPAAAEEGVQSANVDMNTDKGINDSVSENPKPRYPRHERKVAVRFKINSLTRFTHEDEPSAAEVLRRNDSDHWQNVMNTEISTLEAMNC